MVPPIMLPNIIDTRMNVAQRLTILLMHCLHRGAVLCIHGATFFTKLGHCFVKIFFLHCRFFQMPNTRIQLPSKP